MARLDAELAARGLAPSRSTAARLISEGAVEVDGRVATRAAHPVDAASRIRVDEAAARIVGRAAHKLRAALDAFALDVSGALALDVGASTGGFTQVLLDRGAREVIALDVGHDQLVPALRADPRVRVVEGENARELDARRLAQVAGTAETPGIVVVDVSFISLVTVLPALVRTAPDARFVVLVKPQFEVGRQAIGDGVVRDPRLRASALRGVLDAAVDAGLVVRGAIVSPLPGSVGNTEFLAHLAPAGESGVDPAALVDALAAE